MSREEIISFFSAESDSEIGKPGSGNMAEEADQNQELKISNSSRKAVGAISS